MKLPQSVYNWTSILGSVLALISLGLIIFTFTISTFFDLGSSYIGLFIYIIFPMIMVVGLILIPIGIFFARKKINKPDEKQEFHWPKIDLNDVKYRNAFVIFISTTFVFIFISAIGTYEAFHYSESVQFCGTLCHKVMEPEYVAYQNSPHARVACVECHVGPGADWYIRSKLSGMYQVYSVTFGLFPRPIPTPVKSLRPARETCEKCHWPEKFYAQKSRFEKHYLADEKSTVWNINLNMKIGSSHSALGLIEGIHWHINPDIKIEYLPSNQQDEIINWVKTTNAKTGEVQIFEDQSNVLSATATDSISKRVMDCMDCHNRPSHRYASPPSFIDNAITAGLIPQDIPWIKLACIEATRIVTSSNDSAQMLISKNLMDYYSSNYPEVITGNPEGLKKAITGLQKAYSQNVFPYMKVVSSAYPDHIGHKETLGCFRCHDDKHLTKEGKSISKDCNLCHVIKAQGTPGSMQSVSIFDTLEFVHPVDIDNAWKETACSECHSALY
jgi:uncharacterized membrane protein